VTDEIFYYIFVIVPVIVQGLLQCNKYTSFQELLTNSGVYGHLNIVCLSSFNVNVS